MPIIKVSTRPISYEGDFCKWNWEFKKIGKNHSKTSEKKYLKNCCSYRVTKLPEYDIKVIKRAPETMNANKDWHCNLDSMPKEHDRCNICCTMQKKFCA